VYTLNQQNFVLFLLYLPVPLHFLLLQLVLQQTITEKDHATNNFLQWFVEEQVEEEENAMELVGKVKRAQNSVDLMYTLDSELASRVYTPPADKEN
ncbi:ferritin-like domain-containing protein, partial [Methanobrevibacter smithii]|uniref:ferritin-like domain-containing protein n=1 Tax=Methanobrevibacter smithii TaxID=2173 RepID=UPI0037DD4C4C